MQAGAGSTVRNYPRKASFRPASPLQEPALCWHVFRGARDQGVLSLSAQPVLAGWGCNPGALEALEALGADLASVFRSERRPTRGAGAVLTGTVFLEPRGEQ